MGRGFQRRVRHANIKTAFDDSAFLVPCSTIASTDCYTMITICRMLVQARHSWPKGRALHKILSGARYVAGSLESALGTNASSPLNSSLVAPDWRNSHGEATYQCQSRYRSTYYAGLFEAFSPAPLLVWQSGTLNVEALSPSFPRCRDLKGRRAGPRCGS